MVFSSHSHAPAANGLPGGRIRRVVFDAADAAALMASLKALFPGVDFEERGSWTDDPGDWSGGPVGVWYWPTGLDAFLAQSGAVLLRFVHPLVARRSPCVVGFPFSASVFDRPSLDVQDIDRLAVEDIGSLLQDGAAATGCATLDGLDRRPDARRSRPRATASPIERETLDQSQELAVTHGRGPARVLAPAGSGKTKTLVNRAVELVRRGVDPGAILMLAFNTKAADQLVERLAALGLATTKKIVADEHAIHCATFNAFGYRYQREIMRTCLGTEADTRTMRRLMESALKDASSSIDTLKDASSTHVIGAAPDARRLDKFLKALARVRAGLEPPASISVEIESLNDDEPAPIVPFAPVCRAYERRQARTRQMSFDDQIYFAVRDMLADPRHRDLIQRRYEHVLVDEYQDLNGAQLALIDILSRPRRDLFVVGDDDQLIYGWRFAKLDSILTFHDSMPPRPWSATYTLATNYRCSSSIVHASRRLIEHNTMREPKDFRPRLEAAEGSVRLFAHADWMVRGRTAAEFLRQEQERLGCEWRRLAVLCRYQSQLAFVAMALDEAGIPRTPACADAAGDELGRENDEADGIVIATIHAAKGREYDSVVIPDYVSDLGRLHPSQIEEERRVMYVGVTRARDSLLLTLDPTGEVHPFLRELSRPPRGGERAVLAHELEDLRAQEAATAARLARHGQDLAALRAGGAATIWRVELASAGDRSAMDRGVIRLESRLEAGGLSGLIRLLPGVRSSLQRELEAARVARSRVGELDGLLALFETQPESLARALEEKVEDLQRKLTDNRASQDGVVRRRTEIELLFPDFS